MHITPVKFDAGYLKFKDKLISGSEPPKPPQKTRKKPRKEWSGPDCKGCRHYDYWEGMFMPLFCCEHPSIQDKRATLPREERADWAEIYIHREEGGMCGPEAKLFSPRTFWQKFSDNGWPGTIFFMMLCGIPLVGIVITG